MKKRALLLSILAIPVVLMAQPTIHHMNDYAIGEKIMTLDCVPKAPGNGGSNIVWDFSALTPSGSGADTVTQWVIAPPTPAKFPGAAFVTTDGQGTYEYYSKTAGSNYVIGDYDSSGTTTTNYSHPLLSAMRPLTMTTTMSDTLTITAVNSTMPPAQTAKISVSQSVDGYGTLKLPNGTYSNVLRLKLSFSEKATVSFGPITDTLYYKTLGWEWFDDNHNAPLLTIDSSYETVTGSGGSKDSSSDVQYLLKDHTTGVADLQHSQVPFNAVINGSGLLLLSQFESGAAYRVNVFSIAGQKILEDEFTPTGNEVHIDLAQEPHTGIYIVTLMKGKDISSLTTLKVLKN